MNKSTAIQIVQDYLNKKDFHWGAIYHLDEEPFETDEYWVFKNLWEPRESIRGNDIIVDRIFPGIIVDKESAVAQEINRERFDEISYLIRLKN